MDERNTGAAVEAERLSLCELLDGLDDEQWRAPSLCAGWTVREVVAHLTTPTRTSLPAMVLGMARARGDFHRMADRDARRRSARSTPQELVAQLRETAGSPRRMPGSSPVDPLVDVLVHGQDVCRPLGLARPVPVEAARVALAHVSTSTFHGAPARFEGLRLVATDSAWTHGPEDRAAGRRPAVSRRADESDRPTPSHHVRPGRDPGDDMTGTPAALDATFTAQIRTDGAFPAYLQLDGSDALLGTRRAVKVTGTLDGHPFAATLMPSGGGPHWLPLRAALRAAIGKTGAGEQVQVHLQQRST